MIHVDDAYHVQPLPVTRTRAYHAIERANIARAIPASQSICNEAGELLYSWQLEAARHSITLHDMALVTSLPIAALDLMVLVSSR